MTSTTFIPTAHYSAKIRQHALSNKLGNKELYQLYSIRKANMSGAHLCSLVKDGVVTIESIPYVVSYLNIMPQDAFSSRSLTVSLRTPKYIDSETERKPISILLVSR